MKYIFLIAAIWCSVALTSYAQQAPRDSTYNFTLQDCINYAYQHQDSVVNANLDVKSAEYRVKEITGQGLPQISGTASFQDYLKTPSILFPDFISAPIYSILNQQNVQNSTTGKVISATPPAGTTAEQSVSLYQTYNANMGLTLSQIIFDGSYLVGLKASRTYKELSQRNYIRSRIEANVNVTKAYYQVLVSNEQIRLLDANIAQLKQQLDQTVQENKQGFVEKIDVDRITVQYNNLVTNRENTLRLLALNSQMLKFQMGMPIYNNLLLKDSLESVKLDAILETDADTSFYHNRIEYNLGETNVRLNELSLKNTQSAYLPKLTLNGSTSLTYQNDSFSQLFNTSYPATYVGLTLNVPIFSGGQRLNQVRQSKIAVEKSQNDLDNLKNGIALQANSARISYINGLKTLENQRQNQALAQEVLKVARIKYQQGVGSSIEVTQAETDLVNADNEYIKGLYDALISKVDLEQAYGRIK